MNPQILKDIKALSTIQPEHIRKYDRMDVVIKFMQAKKNILIITKISYVH
jgi:hypothetical protein